MISKTTHEPVLRAQWVGSKELGELRKVLDRAMNTLEPVHTPAWLTVLSADVDAAIESSPEGLVRKEYATIRVDYLTAALACLEDGYVKEAIKAAVTLAKR